MTVLAVVLLGAVSLAQGYDKFFTIGPCSATVQTDATIDFKQVAEDNNGTWSYVRVPDTSRYQDLQSMTVVFSETEEAGKYIKTVYEQQNGAQPRKYPPIILHDAGGGHATVDVNLGDIKQDYLYVLAHAELSEDQQSQIDAIIKQYGFLGSLKTIQKYTPPK